MASLFLEEENKIEELSDVEEEEKQEVKVVNFSDAVANLLTEENKNKSLGEVSEDLNDYLIEIKRLVETNEISYDKLRTEIRKHVDQENKLKPGSVAQLLVGCINDECPLQKEVAEDISFIYDGNSRELIPLTNISNPVSSESFAVLYISGDPREVKISSLSKIESMGFKKIKIKHKKINESNYKTFTIDNLEDYIESNKLEFDQKGKFLLLFLVIVLLMLYLSRR